MTEPRNRHTEWLALFFPGLLIITAFTPEARSQLVKDPDQSHGRFGDPMSVAPNLQGYLYGEVKAKNSDSLTLSKTKFGVDREIKLEKKTKFVRDGKSSNLAEVKVGDPVYVAVKTDKKTGEMTAKKIVSGILQTPSR